MRWLVPWTAVHDFDLARFLVGEVEEVHAWASVLFDERFAQADDWGHRVAMLKFGMAPWASSRPRAAPPGATTSGPRSGAAGKVVVDGGQKTQRRPLRRFGYEGDHYENFPDRFEVAYRLELEAFFEALGAGGRPTPGPEDFSGNPPPRPGPRRAELARRPAGWAMMRHGP